MPTSTRAGTLLVGTWCAAFGIIDAMCCLVLLALICDIAAINNGDADLYRASEGFSITGHVIASSPQKKTLTFWSCPDSVKVVAK